MGLWLFYCEALDDEIETACTAAATELRLRGFTPEQAQDAALDAADLDVDRTEDSTPNADAVVAWFAAEDAATRRLYELTGEWPHQAALVWTSGDTNDG